MDRHGWAALARLRLEHGRRSAARTTPVGRVAIAFMVDRSDPVERGAMDESSAQSTGLWDCAIEWSFAMPARRGSVTT
ncbi:MAG TPA: hypothetical protein PKA33_19150 [Amaricoccus sp.]|uniref:hypothetical protein n=1 Tax=Amaricoccus sp. TaxID=1872485 RepID=UPI002C72D41F|nr:hypothetical protein [Amaricoccus sp.]HMQ93548.1 hypothetical protein [Amaricoccus sp.]HMR54442.1 hypothetical protein [Amaricoccus sp.]HMR60970.1 hypothetical protein [Amaricoccus sp.]HMU01459.1 hypothetical protein [Amaricoccus sp.]